MQQGSKGLFLSLFYFFKFLSRHSLSLHVAFTDPYHPQLGEFFSLHRRQPAQAEPGRGTVVV